MGIPDLSPHCLAIGATPDPGSLPRPILSAVTSSQVPLPTDLSFTQSLKPSFLVNNQGPSCPNMPYTLSVTLALRHSSMFCPRVTPPPPHPSHTLSITSLLHLCQAKYSNGFHASRPCLKALSQFCEDHSSSHIPWHTHSSYHPSSQINSRPLQACTPQCLCLYSAHSLPGPGGNKCISVAAP